MIYDNRRFPRDIRTYLNILRTFLKISQILDFVKILFESHAYRVSKRDIIDTVKSLQYEDIDYVTSVLARF